MLSVVLGGPKGFGFLCLVYSFVEASHCICFVLFLGFVGIVV